MICSDPYEFEVLGLRVTRGLAQVERTPSDICSCRQAGDGATTAAPPPPTLRMTAPLKPWGAPPLQSAPPAAAHCLMRVCSPSAPSTDFSVMCSTHLWSARADLCHRLQGLIRRVAILKAMVDT